MEVECSKGTYIRSLAQDLGQKLGCGAHLRNLARLKSGPFCISDAITISRLEEAFRQGHWSELIYPIDKAVLHLPSATVNDENERAIMNGRPLALGPVNETSGQLLRAYSLDGRFIALLRYDEQRGYWRPEKVFKERGES
jgi:tRNA pseudouridine55 synthase